MIARLFSMNKQSKYCNCCWQIERRDESTECEWVCRIQKAIRTLRLAFDCWAHIKIYTSVQYAHMVVVTLFQFSCERVPKLSPQATWQRGLWRNDRKNTHNSNINCLIHLYDLWQLTFFCLSFIFGCPSSLSHTLYQSFRSLPPPHLVLPILLSQTKHAHTST